MPNKQIYQLTETLSVSPDDWLAIDLDSSNLTRKARVGNVFSVSEGSSYTGGTADGIMFNDGSTFATSALLSFDQSSRYLNIGSTSGGSSASIAFRRPSGGYELGRVTGGNSAISWNLSYPMTIQGAFLNLGVQAIPEAQLHTRLEGDDVAQRIDLSNGQTEDAFQINSYGNTGGDLARIMSNGNIVLNGDTITDSTVIDITSPPSSSVVRQGIKVTSTGNSNSTYYAFYANVTGSTPYSFYAASGRAFINGTLDLNYNSLLNVGNTKFIGVPSTQYGNLLVSDESDFSAGSGGQLVFGGNPVGQTGYRAAYGIIKGVKENSTYNNNLGGLAFYTNNQASGYLPLLSTLTERMRINSDGNVGIGTTPFGRLWVKTTDANTTSTIAFLNTSGWSTILAVTDDNTAATPLQFRASKFHFANSDVLIDDSAYAQTASARLHIKNKTITKVAQRIDLSNGQTADAFQINSYGNTGGDLFKVEADGALTLASTTHVIGDGSGGGRIDFRSAGFGSYIESNGYDIKIRGRASSGGGVLLGGTSSATDLEISRDRYVKFYNIGTPTSPDNGAMWYDGTDFKVRLGGVTRTLQVV